MADRTITVESYLVVKGNRGYMYDHEARCGMRDVIRRGKVDRATQRKPSKLLRDEIAVKVAVVIPVLCFEPLNLTDAGLVNVPPGHILSPAFYTEAPDEDEESGS